MFTPTQIKGFIAEEYPENLIFCDSESLLSIAKDSRSITCRANCLAELLIRLYLNEKETVQIEDGKTTLRTQVEIILSHGEVSAFLNAVKHLKTFNPDNAKQLVFWRENADALSLSCRSALEERLQIFFSADGVIPVQNGDDGWLIPFDLQENGKSQYAVLDMNGNVIDEWNDAVSQMNIAPYTVRVHCYVETKKGRPFSLSLIGRSLMLPVWGAFLKKEGKVPDYNPFKLVLSGAFDQGGVLSGVGGINGKAAGLAPDAIFLIPRESDISGLDDNSARNIHMLPNDKKEVLFDIIKQKVERFSEEAELNRKIEAYYNDLEKESEEDQKVFKTLSSYTLLYASGSIPISTEESDNDRKRKKRRKPKLFKKDSEEDDDKIPADMSNDGTNNAARTSEKRDEEERFEKRSGDLLTLMNEYPHIVILGEPGSGKTTTLEYFVMHCHEPEKLAVLIPLGQYPGYNSLWEMIRQATNLSQVELRTLKESNRLRLVLDALNECPDDFRKGLVSDIQSIMEDYPDLPIAISARTDEDLKRLRRLPTFIVQPMDTELQRQYLSSYLNEEKAQSLLNRLLAQPGGTEIASNPLLLKMVLDVFDDHQGKLPMRRADLYRSWIENWYDWEEKKAKDAEDALPWDFNKACRIFSELAFQSRLRGENGEVSAETVEPFFQKYGKHVIEKLCQGPVVALTEEKNSIRFRHETFQEYFCAEYLISHREDPDVLPHLTKADSAQWGMPLAYAAELVLPQPLPEPLLRAAWKIDPWFGFSVTDDMRLGYAAELVSKRTNPFLPQILSCYTLPPEKDSFISPAEMAICNNYWYSNSDPKLGYMVLTNEAIKNRWLGMELGLLRKEYTPKVLSFVLTRSIMLKQYAGSSIHQTFQNFLEAGKDLTSSSLEEHLRAVEEKLLTDEYLPDAIQLIQDGFASKDDCMERVPKWIKGANAFDIVLMIKMGLAIKKDFEDRLSVLIETADVNVADILIKGGLVTDDVKTRLLRRLIESAKLVDAWQMVKRGLATKEDFKDRLKNWIRNVSITDAERMINVGLATEEDFKDEIDNLIEKVTTPNEFMSLVRTGLASEEDLEKIIAKWKLNPDPSKAIFLVQNGWASIEDFKNKIPSWISNAVFQPEMAVRFIHAEMVSIEELNGWIEKWKKEANPQMAVYLIQNGLASREDFKDRIAEWILKANPQMVVYLIQNRLASKKDFKDKIEIWKSEAGPERIHDLIQNDLASREELEDRIKQLISKADHPKTAFDLVRFRFASKEDFKEKIEQWEKVDPAAPWRSAEKILSLIQYGWVSKENYTAEIETWKKEAGLEIAILLYKCNLAKKDDFKDRSEQWGLDFTYLPYRRDLLEKPIQCQAIKNDLQGKKWKMRIVSHDASYSFLSGFAFKKSVFCSNSILKNGPTTYGSVWSVVVGVGLNPKRNCDDFHVRWAEYKPTGDEEEDTEPERNTASPADMNASPATDAVQTEDKETETGRGGIITLGDIWDKNNK